MDMALGFSAVVQVLASVPSPMQTLFTSFWAAVDGRALSGLDRMTASAAFLSSVLECGVYMARRLMADDGAALLAEEVAEEPAESEENEVRMTARALVCEQVKRAWEELSAQRLKMNEKLAADYLARTLTATDKIDEGESSSHTSSLSLYFFSYIVDIGRGKTEHSLPQHWQAQYGRLLRHQ